MKTFLLYGSYGYTGQLIAEQALREGLRPILAGRDRAQLRRQAERLSLEYRAFRLEDSSALESALQEVAAVLHCAGPFVHTFRRMAEACLRTRRHYVDISGEIEGFEALAALDGEARSAGVMLLPGAGFDVVPTDCLAAHLKRRLPGATHLSLFIRGVGAGISRGTAASAIENMHRQGRVRRAGKIVQVPPAWRVLERDFGRGPVRVVSIGWGDVSTAYHSTGIPNIETYMAFPRLMIDFMHAGRVIGPVSYSRPVKNLLKALLNFLPAGPPLRRRERGLAIVRGEVSDGQGGRAVSKLETPEAYTLTALTAVEIMKRILAGGGSTGETQGFKPGFQTPSRAFGPDFILGFPHVTRRDL
jgi:short subunit dehydrogenase-like uncharacterized protein